jgi:dihydroflavonol-4-reductase
MKILITGGTGFIGKALLRRLRETRHKLYCLAREGSKVEPLIEAHAAVIRGDVTDRQSLIEGMKGCDWAVNLANFYEFWAADRGNYRRVNVDGTVNVMEAAIATGISKIVHVSTAAVFDPAERPVTESSRLGAPCPTTYVGSKREGERRVWALYGKGNLPLVVIYPSAVLGSNDPKASGRYIRSMIRGKMPAQVMTKTSFSFVHVDDVAKAILKALEKEDNIGERYIVSAENRTWGEINWMIGEISGARLPRLTLPDWMAVANARLFTALARLTGRPPLWDMAVDQIELMRQGYQIDGSKAERELGFTYRPVREAIRDAIESCAP